MTSLTRAKSAAASAAGKPGDKGLLQEENDNDADADTTQEEFITLPKPKPFTRAIADSVERRPAAILATCQFLNKLLAKCKEDLHKLGCARQPHQYSFSEKPARSQPSPYPQDVSIKSGKPAQRGGQQHHHHHHKEPWEKRMQRLKIYQRAFSSIVMYFKAYSPVLFHIKKTYEDMLSYRIHQIKTAHFERKRLHILKHSMRQEIREYQFPEVMQLKKNEQYCGILRQRINLQEEAIKVITGILSKMEEALSEHFERHRDLEEQIIMVDNEIANRRQKAYSQREKEENEEKEKKKEAQAASTSELENAEKQQLIDSDEEDEDDPFRNMDPDEIDEERRMVWIMAFAICHKDFEEAEKKLNMYQTKYQYVVPRHEQEEMKRSIIEQRFGAKNLVDEKNVLEEELGNLKELEAKLEEELAQVKEQLTELRTTVTPRPSWEQLGEFIHGGVPKWERMIQGKSTKDVSEKLFSELRSRRGAEKFLQPLGVEHSVLRCLRYGKKVSDRQLHSRDAALLIHDIWLSRKKALEENSKAPAKAKSEFDYGLGNQNKAEKGFPDYVALYFEEFYEDEVQRMEWTYNLVECCKRFSLDYRLTLFLDVLQQQSDEGLYFATRNELFRVRNAFLQKSVDEGMVGGTLSSNQYVEALEAIFPKKDEPEIQSIVRVTNKLNQELNGGVEGADLSIYKITQLLDMRDDGFRGVVVGELVKQFEKDRQLFINKIVETLAGLLGISSQSAQNELDPASNRDVSVMDVYEAIKKTDSDIDDDIVGAALAWVFTQTSVLPGGGISTSRLVNYCRLHTGEGESMAPSVVSLVPSQDMSQMDEEQFERAIKDIVREDEDDEEERASEATKKALYKALKMAKLRTVVKRLKGSALVSSDKAYDPENDSVLPEDAINLETDLQLLKKEEVPQEEKRGSKDIPQQFIDELQFDEDGEEVSIMGTGENSEVPSAPGTVPSVPQTPTTPNPTVSNTGAPAAAAEAGGQPSAASLPS